MAPDEEEIDLYFERMILREKIDHLDKLIAQYSRSLLRHRIVTDLLTVACAVQIAATIWFIWRKW